MKWNNSCSHLMLLITPPLWSSMIARRRGYWARHDVVIHLGLPGGEVGKRRKEMSQDLVTSAVTTTTTFQKAWWTCGKGHEHCLLTANNLGGNKDDIELIWIHSTICSQVEWDELLDHRGTAVCLRTAEVNDHKLISDDMLVLSIKNIFTVLLLGSLFMWLLSSSFSRCPIYRTIQWSKHE